MRVRCVANKNSDLPSNSRVYRASHGDAELGPQIGEEYTVYGISGHSTEILYSILSDKYSSFPEWYPSILFEVVDGRVPPCWVFTPLFVGQSDLQKFILTFPEWSVDPSFEWNLIDGSPSHQEIWQKYKALIDQDA